MQGYVTLSRVKHRRLWHCELVHSIFDRDTITRRRLRRASVGRPHACDHISRRVDAQAPHVLPHPRHGHSLALLLPRKAINRVLERAFCRQTHVAFVPKHLQERLWYDARGLYDLRLVRHIGTRYRVQWWMRLRGCRSSRDLCHLLCQLGQCVLNGCELLVVCLSYPVRLCHVRLLSLHKGVYRSLDPFDPLFELSLLAEYASELLLHLVVTVQSLCRLLVQPNRLLSQLFSRWLLTVRCCRFTIYDGFQLLHHLRSSSCRRRSSFLGFSHVLFSRSGRARTSSDSCDRTHRVALNPCTQPDAFL